MTPADRKRLLREFFVEPNDAALLPVQDLMATGSDEAWRFLLELVRVAPDAEALTRVGASAMESFFGDFNAERHRDEIARLLDEDERFCAAFASQWVVPKLLEPLLERATARLKARRGGG